MKFFCFSTGNDVEGPDLSSLEEDDSDTPFTFYNVDNLISIHITEADPDRGSYKLFNWCLVFEFKQSPRIDDLDREDFIHDILAEKTKPEDCCISHCYAKNWISCYAYLRQILEEFSKNDGNIPMLIWSISEQKIPKDSKGMLWPKLLIPNPEYRKGYDIASDETDLQDPKE